MGLKRGGLLEERGAGGVGCTEGERAGGSVRQGVEPPSQRVRVVEMGVRRHRSYQSCLWGQSSHRCFQQLCEHDVIRVPAVSIHQSLSGNVLDYVFLVVVPHST